MALRNNESEGLAKRFPRLLSLSSSSSRSTILVDPHSTPVNNFVGDIDSGSSKGENKNLPSFWVPTLTPDAKPATVEAPRESILCAAGDPEHSISLIRLIAVLFSTSKTDNGMLISCPSCLKALRNGMRMNCGHVVCGTCTDKFVKKSGHCFVCEKRCKEKELVTLQTEGTGLAGGGGKLRTENVEVAYAG
ncbi:hypothetical protein BJ742DRAFT_769028 [Cladochytrium replicatum]|nr:hypothetical protein BJ742DRAFT_769028 [Cladochytrium replicatum]